MNAIETKNLTKKYKDKIAVDSLNLSISEGELFALLGVNGAGKTTAIKMLCCLTKPTSGDAVLLGDSVITDKYAVKAKINISPQETAVAPNLTVCENLEFVAGIHGEDRKSAQQKAKEMLTMFALDEVAKSKARTLSGGMQRRLSIALALISNPKILFLDEPTLGLDVIARRELWKVIEQLKGKVTILLTTHYMEEAEALSDRVGILANGGLRAVGTVKGLIALTKAKTFEDAFIALATTRETSV